ncbi:MAG: LysR family transcriptional regulator [Polyangiales bacterium]
MLEARDQHLLFVFAAIVRNGSFTRAAAELGVTKSVVSTHLRTLEERLGVRLMERTTRQQRLTEVGSKVYQTAERMVSLSATVSSLVESRHEGPMGTLRVGAQTDLGAHFVTPVLAALCEEYPALDVDVFYDDRKIDLIDTSVEVTVRLGVPKDSQLVVKKIASDEEIIVAAPALHQKWSPAKPGDLRDAPWLAHREVLSRRVVFRGPKGARAELSAVRHRALVSTARAAIDLARAGVGFVVLPEILVRALLREGALVRVLPGWRRRKVGVYVVRPSRDHTPPRVRVFIDAMTKALSAHGP